MHQVEVVAIDGLDAAIIGTTVRGTREVLAYDYDKAVEILMDHGYTQESAEDWIKEVTSAEFDGAPTFVYLDYDKDTNGTDTISSTIH